MKLCKACKHFVHRVDPAAEPLCGHPAVRSPVDGAAERSCKSLRQLGPHAPSGFGCDGDEIRGYANVRQKVEEAND
jgi:hypothetical protein